MKRFWRYFWLGSLLACTGCTVWAISDQPGGSPPSAAIAVAPTPAGFAEVFQRECIDQADLKWALAEAARRVRWNCFGDDASDCASADAQDISYLVPTQDHATVIVNVFLYPELDRLASCSVDVSDRHAAALQAAVARLRVGGKAFAHLAGDDASGWHVAPLESDHRRLDIWQSKEFYSNVSATFWPDYDNGPDRAHPWVLVYNP